MEIDIISEDFIENLTHHWQYEIAILLKQELLENHIEGEVAKEIVGNFLFSMSMMYDQHGITYEDKTYLPRLAFEDENQKTLASEFHNPIHEFAFGNASEAFVEDNVETSKAKGLLGWFKK